MKRILAMTAGSLALLATAAVGAASIAQAAPKPGFQPGTWIGKGTITGNVVDGPMATHFDGNVAFTLKVSRKLAVSGTGTWRLNMLGSQEAPSSYGVDTTMQGSASVRFAGPATGPAFSGSQHVTGEIRTADVHRPISFDRPLTGRLVIARAWKCKVVGRTTIQPGVTLVWSAVLKGGKSCG